MSVAVETLSLVNLATLYNLLADKPITKFKDKATGVARLSAKLVETKHEIFEVEGEFDVRPIPEVVPMEEKVDIHAASNKLISDALARDPELAAMVKVGGGKRGRKSNLIGKKLAVIRDKNPKRAGSRTAVRYEVYHECKTSDDFIRICEERNLGTRREILSDLDYDSKQEFIRLS